MPRRQLANFCGSIYRTLAGRLSVIVGCEFIVIAVAMAAAIVIDIAYACKIADF